MSFTYQLHNGNTATVSTGVENSVNLFALLLRMGYNIIEVRA